MEQKDIAHLATLARIDLSAGEAAKLAEDITEVLEYVATINAISGDAREKKVGARSNILRDDKETHEPGMFSETLLDAAPVRTNRYIEVQKIIDPGT